MLFANCYRDYKMKKLLLLLSLISFTAQATDRGVPCNSNSCKVKIVTKNSGGTDVTSGTFDDTKFVGVGGILGTYIRSDAGIGSLAPAIGRRGYLIICSSNYGAGGQVRSLVTHLVTDNEGTAISFFSNLSTLNGQTATFGVSAGYITVSGLSAGNNSCSVYY